MQQIECTAHIEASPERVFELISDHEGMARWSDAREVVLRHPGYPAPNGVGAVRVIRARGVAVEEEVVAYDPPKRMEYRVTAGIPVRDHHGEIVLEPVAGGTQVVWRVRFRPRIPGTGWLLRRGMEGALNRMLSQLKTALTASSS